MVRPKASQQRATAAVLGTLNVTPQPYRVNEVDIDDRYEYFERIRDYEFEPVTIARRLSNGGGVPEQWTSRSRQWTPAPQIRPLLERGIPFLPINAEDAARALDPAMTDPARTVRAIEPLDPSMVAVSEGSGGWGALTTMAIALHEAYTAYVSAGFTEEQAMALVLEMLRQGSQRHDDHRDDER